MTILLMLAGTPFRRLRESIPGAKAQNKDRFDVKYTPGWGFEEGGQLINMVEKLHLDIFENIVAGRSAPKQRP